MAPAGRRSEHIATYYALESRLGIRVSTGGRVRQEGREGTKAVVDGIAGDFEPETLLWFNVRHPEAAPASRTRGPPADSRSATASTASRWRQDECGGLAANRQPAPAGQ